MGQRHQIRRNRHRKSRPTLAAMDKMHSLIKLCVWTLYLRFPCHFHADWQASVVTYTSNCLHSRTCKTKHMVGFVANGDAFLDDHENECYSIGTDLGSHQQHELEPLEVSMVT